MRTVTTEVAQQEAIAKDNVPVKIHAVIWRRIFDPGRAVIAVVNVEDSIVQVAVTALRNIIGQRTLDDVLKEQETLSVRWQEAARAPEKRARKIKAEAEVEAATLLQQAAQIIMHGPAGLELRRTQMITEASAEQNTMTIIMTPREFVEMARAFSQRNAERV
jgi:regulator of protease activity HflC (stomatin/prohibitin superfamily)